MRRRREIQPATRARSELRQKALLPDRADQLLGHLVQLVRAQALAWLAHVRELRRFAAEARKASPIRILEAPDRSEQPS